MIDRTSSNWEPSQQDQEAIDRALDRWEAADPDTRGAQLSEFCPDERLLPHFEERVHELEQIAKYATDAARDQPPTQPLESIDSIRLIESISCRSNCDVYKGEQKHPERVVAVKVFRGDATGSKNAKRFAHEIRLLAKLRHASIAEIHFAGECESNGQRLLYFAMEYVEGPPVTEYAEAAKLTLRGRVELFAHVCKAVGHAHQRGVIHRDLKPSNILTTKEGLPKVLDFGIAKSLDPSDVAQTQIGVGTPAYMSPEQFSDAQGQSVHTDIYSLGVLLYELIGNESPYGRTIESMAQAAKVICDGEVIPVQDRNGDCPQDLAAIIHRCLKKRPEDRYQGVPELVSDLQNFLSGRPVSARPLSTLGSLTRWTNRNRAASFSILFAAASLLAGAIVSLVYWQRAEGVVTELNSTVGKLNVARAEAEAARDSLQTQLTRSRRSEVNNVLSLADRHWESSPNLAERWLDDLGDSSTTIESFAWKVNRRRANRVAAEARVQVFPVISVNYVASKNWIVSASKTGVVSAWDLNQGAPVWEKEMGISRVHHCDVSLSGGTVLVGEKTQLVLLDLMTGENVRRVDAGPSFVKRAMYSPRGDLIVAIGDSNQLSVWNADLTQKRWELTTDAGGFLDVAIDRESSRLMAIGKKGTVNEWSLDDGEMIESSRIPKKNLSCAGISSELDEAFFAERYHYLSHWEGADNGAVSRVLSRRERFDHLHFSADNEWLIALGRNQIRGRHRGADWAAQWTQQSRGRVSSFASTDAPNLFALGFADGRVQLRWIDPPPIDTVLAEDLPHPKQILQDVDGTHIVVVGDTITSLDAMTLQAVRRYANAGDGCVGGACHSSGTIAIATGKRKQLMRIRPGDPASDLIHTFGTSINAVAYLESPDAVLVGLGDGRVSIFDYASGKLEKTVEAHADTTTVMAVSPREKIYVSGSAEGELAFWNETHELLARLNPHSNQITDIAYSPDGKRLYSVCYDGKLSITDTETLSPELDRVLMAGRIHAIAVSTDGETLAVGGADNDIYLLDAVTGEWQATLSGHGDSIADLKFTHDGESLLSISADGTLRIWTPTETARWKPYQAGPAAAMSH